MRITKASVLSLSLEWVGETKICGDRVQCLQALGVNPENKSCHLKNLLALSNVTRRMVRNDEY